MWTAHNYGKLEGIQEGIEQGIEQGIELGREEGIEEGREQGRAEGGHKKAIETAQNLTNMGLSDEQIAQATGLPLEQVKNLR